MDCRHCPLKSKCIGKSDFKKIEDTVDKPLYDRMHERLQTWKAKQMKKLRSSTVEPVLGTLINYLGMRRINTRGIKQANKCMIMAAVAYNLKKLLKWSQTKIQTGELAMKKTVKSLNSYLYPLQQYRNSYTLIMQMMLEDYQIRN